MGKQSLLVNMYLTRFWNYLPGEMTHKGVGSGKGIMQLDLDQQQSAFKLASDEEGVQDESGELVLFNKECSNPDQCNMGLGLDALITPQKPSEQEMLFDQRSSAIGGCEGE